MNVYLAAFYIWSLLGLGWNMIMACYPDSVVSVPSKQLPDKADIFDIINHYFDLTIGLILVIELWPFMVFGYFKWWKKKV